MKKHYNAFKANRFDNILRVLAIVCIAGVALVVILFASTPQNRRTIASWFGIEKANIASNQAKSTETNDAGINGAVSVNSSIAVRPLEREDHLWGPIDAPVNLIVYDDFECPFCAQFYETVNRAKLEFGNDLVVAVRHFPLISHEQAIPAAIASECASAQKKFWEMYKLLYEDNKAGNLKPETIVANGATLGLDEKAFNECLTKETYKDKILAQKDEVKNLGVIGTPASFINNQYVPGALPYEDFTYPDGSAALGLRSLIQQKLNANR